MVTIRDMRPPIGARFDNHRKGLEQLAELFYGEVRLLVEVGSWKGESARIFSRWVNQVVCVDSWAVGLPPESPYTMEDVHQEYCRNVADLNNVAWLRMPSVDASVLFCDGALDAVYIDASHQYRNVLADIRAWMPKVRKGGILAGHDYDMAGVAQAVYETIGEPHNTFADNSWLWRKAA